MEKYVKCINTVTSYTSASHWSHSIVLCAKRVFRYCANEYKMDANGKSIVSPFQWCIHVQLKTRGI